ncbi:DNA-directed RNA polymerase III subunit RPC3 isoform X2 [Lepisosteus oculatus]|uniref:DNA-directed RNA polymerase III subunit RPC3 isoform X2 n=1 Tax=Lepisosteus oculatus TaxID=7918 RepID=UPI00371B96DE
MAQTVTSVLQLTEGGGPPPALNASCGTRPRFHPPRRPITTGKSRRAPAVAGLSRLGRVSVQMTAQEVRLCALLLQEHFGEVVEKVGTFLLKGGEQTLRAIATGTGTPLHLVKKCLCVLLQQGLCEFGPGRRGVEYRLPEPRVLGLLRFPRYIYTAKTLYGDAAELLVEELLQHGHMTMSQAVRTVADRLTDSMEEGKSMEYSEVTSVFSRLVETHFLQRCPPVAERSGDSAACPAPTLADGDKERYTLPHITLTGRGKRPRASEDSEGDQRAKRARLDTAAHEAQGDDGIYWQVNFERFHQHFRDQAIVSAVASKLDQTSSEIVRTMLRMSEVTTPSGAACTQPLSCNEIFRALPPSYSITRPVLDQYLSLLVDDPMEFVGKSGDSGGGMFVINLHRALTNLARATLESAVQERFGSRSARIFRLLLRKRHLEQKQVEDFAMIPAKEAKEMMYRMLSENLVQLQEIPKTPDHAPSRTFYLYTVNPLPTARMLLQHCYKTVANLIERRLFETKENKRLLEKSQRIEAILASLQASGAEPGQLAEVEEMITAPERQQLEALRRHVNKLDSSENQVDETMFLLESYISSTQASR